MMEYESVAELSRYAIESFTDPVIIVNPIQWKDWSNQELDVFLSKETKLPDWEIDEDFNLDLPKSVFEKIRRRDTKPMKHGSQKDPTEYKQ